MALVIVFALSVAGSGCDGSGEVLSALKDSAKIIGDASVSAIESRGKEVTVDGRHIALDGRRASGRLPEPSLTVTSHESQDSYMVPGGDYSELAGNLHSASMKAARSKGASDNEIAWTLFQVARKAQMSCESDRGALKDLWDTHCAASVSVDATIEIVLPQAVSPLGAADTAKWQGLVQRIREHEDGHADIDRQTVQNIRSALSLPGLLTEDASARSAEEAQKIAMDALEARVGEAIDEVMARDKAAQDDYHRRVGTSILIDSR